jgi:hypothetical protein
MVDIFPAIPDLTGQITKPDVAIEQGELGHIYKCMWNLPSGSTPVCLSSVDNQRHVIIVSIAGGSQAVEDFLKHRQVRRPFETRNQSMGKTAKRTYRASSRACLRIWFSTWPRGALDRTWIFKQVLVRTSQYVDAL